MATRRGPKPGEQTAKGKSALDAGREKAHEATRARAASRRAARAANPDAKSRHQMLMDGELSVRDLDREELKAGRGRDIDGELKGRVAPIPQRIVAKMHQEIFRLHGEIMRSALVDATDTLVELANSPEVKDEVRIKAAAILLERNVGKVPQDIRVGSIDPWEQILDDMLDGKDHDVAIDRARERLGRMAPKEDA